MIPEAARERSLAELVRRADAVRRPAQRWLSERGHKEWHHFCAATGELDVIVNFSLFDDLRHAARLGDELARITCLVRVAGVWEGDVEVHPSDSVRVQRGSPDMSFGENSIAFRDGAYQLRVQLRQREVRAELSFRPLAFPTNVNNVSISDCPPIHWLVVPRLEVTGTVEVGGRTHRVDALGYHDHNWGYFRWGKNFAWEWGSAQPKDRSHPWTLAYSRLTNRAHTSDLMQGLLLWKNQRPARTFQDHELRVWHEGFLRPRRVLRVPRIMNLVATAGATNVPAHLHIEAASRCDRFECVFHADDLCQVVIPNDDDLGLTVINEVSGRLRAHGNIAGEELALETSTVFEFLGA
jgi:hypothetical protein